MSLALAHTVPRPQPLNWRASDSLATWRSGSWLVVMLFVVQYASAREPSAIRWSQLPWLPAGLGLAGSFAGVSGGALIVAGGANFPGKMPWEGGRKVWHETVFVLDQPNGRWTTAGPLPRPLAYGVSASHRDKVVCVGGSDAERHFGDCFRLRWKRGKLAVESLPRLPIALAYMSGALAGNTLYIVGGTEEPGEQRATSRCFALDLGSKRVAWRELEPIPAGPRLLSIAAAQGNVFYLFGGAALETGATGTVARVYLREAWSYRPGKGWRRLADLPSPRVAAPSPAPFVNGRFLLLGGDDGSRVDFKPIDQHPGFARAILAYHPGTDTWSEVGEVPAPRATAACVNWRGRCVVPSGEVRPGVRSPEVWSLETP